MQVVRCGALSFRHYPIWGAIAAWAVPCSWWDVRASVLLLWVPAVPGHAPAGPRSARERLRARLLAAGPGCGDTREGGSSAVRTLTGSIHHPVISGRCLSSSSLKPTSTPSSDNPLHSTVIFTILWSFFSVSQLHLSFSSLSVCFVVLPTPIRRTAIFLHTLFTHLIFSRKNHAILSLLAASPRTSDSPLHSLVGPVEQLHSVLICKA